MERYIKLVELVPHMLHQVRLKIQKYQFRRQMRLFLKNGCQTSWYLVGAGGAATEVTM
jgi:hypothetical protein